MIELFENSVANFIHRWCGSGICCAAMTVTPRVHDGVMEFASTVEFAAAARKLSREAARRGLVAPSFRCPPRLLGADRTIRRRRVRNGPDSAVVSVRVKGRPREAVLADMIEGAIVANQLVAPEAGRVRTALWTCLAALSVAADDVRRGAA